MNIRELTNFGIDKFFSENKDYGECISKDELKDYKGEKKFYIVNMEDSNGSQGGTHWVLMYMCNPNVGIYFDSFATTPPTVIEKSMKQYRKVCCRNTNIVQNLKSVMCGYYCCYCVEELCKGRKFVDVMDDFNSSVNENEKLISKFYYNNKTKFKTKES